MKRVVRAVFAAALVAVVCGGAWAEVTISVDGGNGLVSIDGATPARLASKSVEAGTKVTLSYQASEEPSVGFYQWEGLPINVYPFNTNVTVTVDADMTVNAKEGGVVYVARYGDDLEGDGTRSNPFASLQRAMMAVEEFGEVRVGSGLYVGNLTNSAAFKLVKNVSFKGCYNDDWVQDYRNSRTILAARGSNGTTTKRDRYCVFLHDVQTNRLDGFDITCGSSGIVAQGENFNGTVRKAFGPYTHTFVTHCIITNNSDVGLHHNVNFSGDGDYGYAVASSLIAFNGTHGVWVKNDEDTTSHCRYYNCTIVSNKSNGVYGYGAFQNRLSNSIVAFNGLNGSSNDLNPGTDGCKMYLANMCAYGAKGGAQGGSAAAYIPDASFVGSDPKFTGFFELAAASLCNKRGADLSADQWLPVDTDLYGTPWNGEYDVGCIKSEHPKVDRGTYDEVWVSGDGDDDNAGDSDASPVRTLAVAQMRANPGATVHVGPGTYADGFSLSGTGAKIVGAGPDMSRISLKGGAGVAVLDHSVRIEGLTIEGAATGVNLGKVGDIFATNVVVCNCVIRNCSSDGFYMEQDNVNTVPYTNFVSHCVISNCAAYALHGKGIHSGNNRHGDLLVDNSLICFNGHALYSDFQPPAGAGNRHRFVNCTVVSNKTDGLVVFTGLTLQLVNSVVSHNGTKNLGTSGVAISLANSIVNGLISDSTGNTKIVDSYAAVDPLLDGSFRLTARSLGNKSGQDLSGSLESFLTDLEGKPWEGEYDMGCYKSPFAKEEVKKYDEIWVAADGDDENEGNVPDQPLKTLGMAQTKLRSGGTVHLGEGTFTDPFTLTGDGSKLLGAGRGKTVIQVSGGSDLSVFGHSAVIDGVTVSGGAYGIKVGFSGNINSTNVLVRDCEIRNCSTGFFMEEDNVNPVHYTNRLSHCVISNCTSYGLYAKGIHSGSNRRGTLLLDASLAVRNKQAYYSDWQGGNTHVFVNCTVVSNTTSGFTTGNSLSLTFRNSIVADNGSPNISCNSRLTMDHSLANKTLKGSPLSLVSSFTNFTDSACLKFDTREGRKYHLTDESPACRYGSRKHLLEDPAVDLDGKALRSRRPDAGCYFSDPIGLMLYVR